MLEACGGVLPGNLLFPGPDHRATGFLHRFEALSMVSTDQGCPNASLEAMACGLAVVANPGRRGGGRCGVPQWPSAGP